MGQKVNPIGFRTGILVSSKSRWYAEGKAYRDQVLKDLRLREFLEQRLVSAGVVKIDIERSINKVNVVLHVARPGVVIGRGGSMLKELQLGIAKMLNADSPGSNVTSANLDVVQVEQPDLEARLVAQRLADQIKNRYPHRRAVAQAIERVMRAGAKGVKLQLSGRIGGAEIGRVEKYHQGTVPTQTLRSDLSFAQVPSLTKSGYVGVKVWINRGEKEL